MLSFSIFLFCAVGQLAGQEPSAAEGPFAGLDDVAGFIATRRAAIATKVDMIHGDFVRHKRLPEGVSGNEGQSSLLMSGRLHPELFDHATALMLLLDQYNSSFRDVCVRGLIARGFRPEDLAILAALVDDPDYPDNVIREKLERDLQILHVPDREKAGDEAVKQYLLGWREIAARVQDAWAASVLDRFPLRARRILFAYAYEKIVPNSHMTQWLPITDGDVQDFRHVAVTP